MNINYNFILEKFILKIGGVLFNSSFINILNELRNYNHFSSSQFDKIQYQKLSNLLNLATDKTNFYKGLKNKRKEDPYEWLQDFPVIGKTEINKYGNQMLTLPPDNLIIEKSSGSSGFQTTIYLSAKDQDIERAVQILWWEWAGYKIGDPVLQTGMALKRTFTKKIKDFFFRTYYLHAFDYKEEEVVKALLWAKRKKAPVLAGYASSLYVIAQIAIKNHVKVEFKTAISLGDKLFPHYKREIKKAFSCDVYETYGTTEGFRIAAQKDLDHMYIMTPDVILELLDNNGDPVKDGEIGHVVVTNLNSHGMPLIRFKIGDLAVKLPQENYPAKREVNLPVLKKVIGRNTDIVKTPNGNSLVVHSFTGIFEHIDEIKQFAVVQNDLSGIIIKYIPADGFESSILGHIKSRILDLLKEDFKIVFEEVEFIPPTPSGKPQIIISNLKKKYTELNPEE